MRTLAERFGFRPTQFLPNGCGAGWTAKLVPDEIAGANFDACCDLHDLAYHIGRGGFLGLFYTKPAVDFQLAACLWQRFQVRAQRLKKHQAPTSNQILVGSLGTVVPVVYFVALQLLGWSPLTWPWIERPIPSHEQLVALAHNQND